MVIATRGSSLSRLVVTAVLAAGLLAPRAQDPKPAPPAGAQADVEAAKEAKVRELLAATGADKLAMLTMKQTLEALRTLPGLPEGFVEKFVELAKPAEIMELVVPVYMKHIAAADLDPLLTFMRSDVGKRWVDAQPAILQESSAAGQKWGAALGARAARELDEGK